MRSVKILRAKGKFIIVVVADGYNREYEVNDLEVAEIRAKNIKTILQIK